MARIELSIGMFTLVDDSDLALMSNRPWYLSSNGYAVSREGTGKRRLHSLLFGDPDGMDIDHVNGDRLDNRRQNLRIVTRAQNLRNVAESWPVVSKYVGVYRRFIWDRWFVMVSIGGGSQYYCGDYACEEAAARAHDSAAAYYCPRDKTNFPDPVPMDQRAILIANGQCEPPKSSYRGVSESGGSKGGKYKQKWSSQIYAGRTYKLGHFDSQEDAALVYDAACVILGKLDRMNFPGCRPAEWAMEKASSVVESVISAA